MLINFYFENFRSLFNKSNLSMQKGAKRELEETLINEKINGKDYTLLPNKVIYGVNASGKTSVILAMMVLKEIIINGSINSQTDNSVLSELSIYRFLHEKDKFVKPLTLGICFLYNDTKYEYEIKIASKEENIFIPYILYENLIVNDITIFERKKNKFKFNPKNIQKFKKYINMTGSYLNTTEKLLEENIDSNVAFTKWFNYNGKIINEFVFWFSTYFNIFDNVDKIRYTSKINEKDKVMVIFNQAIKRMVKEADIGPQKIEFAEEKISENQTKTYLESCYEMKGLSELQIMEYSERIESLGTLKLIKFLGPFLKTILTGGVIVVDELDSSIHPEIIASIIATFNDPTVNVNGGQLIFTTHNPVFLNKNLLRRDEIVFVEKDPDTYISEMNTLDDFNIKIDEKYLKNYLEGKYINFTNINFSSIIRNMKERLINDEKKN